MKIFITGTTGYIGHNLLVAAIKKGYEVHALIRSLSIKQLVHPDIHYFEGDVTDLNSIIESMKGCDAVFHTAGITQLWHRDSSIFYKVNVGGTKNVLEAALYHGVQKFVFTSSCAVLGPSDNYPISEEYPRITAFENDYEIS